MIPPFDEYGNLPPGIHNCTIENVVERFGSGSPEREVQVQELVQFVEWARRAGIQRLIVNGSFVTNKVSPNDVDIVVLPGADYPKGQTTVADEGFLFPFLEIVVAADEVDLAAWVFHDFGTDRERREKGVIEVVL